MPAVSIVIPTYNGADVLARAVASIRAQEGVGEVEVVVADDASTDGTADLARRLGCVVLEGAGNSGGPNRGRNRGLAAATGDWVGLMDQDDEFAGGKLRAQLDAAEATGARVVWCGLEIRDRSGAGRTELRGVEPPGVTAFAPDEVFRRVLRRDYRLSLYPSALLFGRELAPVRFEEHFGLVDYDYILRLLRGQRAAHVGAPLVIRHVDGANLSLDPRYRRIDYYYSLMALEAYEAEFPAETAEARRKLNGTRARYFYLLGDMRAARRYFLRAPREPKILLYLLTTFAGSSWVRRRYRIFG